MILRPLTARSGLVARTALRFLLTVKAGETVTQPPVLIGGLGGSGTRAVTILLRRAGWWMGRWVGHGTQDSIPLIFFHRRWFRRLFEYPEVSPRTERRALAQLHRTAELHRTGIPGPAERWGWKHVTGAWLLPFHAAMYPEMKFIHVIRDGRDMALTNPHALLRLESEFLGLDKDDVETAQMQLWTMGHNRAADAAAKHLAPGHYLELRYEDLCAHPHETVTKLFGFLGAPEELVDDACRDVRPSPAIGRWRSEESAITARMTPAFRMAMERFGYD